jgi:hypothetical protein
MMDGAVDGIRDGIVRDMTVSAKYAADGRMKGAVALLNGPRPDLVGGVPAAFATVPRDAVQAVISRSYKGKVFSDRIWDLRKFSQNAVQDTVAKGILQGKSAYEMSKELEAFLLMSQDEAKAFARVWAEKHTDEWKAAWKTRGRLKYNTRRLARTEINNAYREGAVQSAKRAPWVKGVKWNLSGSHVKPDICDDWATGGDGNGVYAPGDAPIDHANGLCFLTDELVSDEELAQISREQIGVVEEEAVEVAERTAEDVRKDVLALQAETKAEALREYRESQRIMKEALKAEKAGNKVLGQELRDDALVHYNRRRQLTANLHDETRKLLYVDDAGFNIEVHAGAATDEIVATVQSGVDEFSKLVDKSIIKTDIYGDPKPIRLRGIAEGERAFARGSTINIAADDEVHTVVHELGHWLEDNNNAVRNAANKFLNSRTVGEKAAEIGPGYGVTEFAKKDKFLTPYMGRIYEGGRQGAPTEIVSMGLQHFTKSTAILAEEDPGYFNFIYNLLRGKF